MAKQRTWLFRLIMFSIPVLFFVVLEVILRVVGYGNSYPLFISTPDSENYILARPDIINRYFPDNVPKPSVTMEANLFLKQKPENGLRLFVQGGSTAAGFPYGLGASPAGMLDQRLKQTFPDKHVEVINTAMSAVNTFTVLDFADEIIAQQPDAVLIYSGHNEFLGIMGVGSNFSALGSYGANLMMLALRDFRFYQLLQNIYVGLFIDIPGETNSSGAQVSRTFMSKVAKEKNIVLDSEMYQAGLEQYKNNLTAIIRKYQKADIPVYLSTLASNLKDQQPFVSAEISNDSKLALNGLIHVAQSGATLNQLQTQINRVLNEGNNKQSADAHFMVAKTLEMAKHLDAAKPYFAKAKELDLLRFRAPDALNRIIKELAKEEGVYLVDYEQNLASKSPAGVIGKEFMLEHLHPNLPGYFVLADTFYQSLMSNTLKPFGNTPVDTNTAWRFRPVLPAEEYYAYAQIVQLKADYPFVPEPVEFVLPKPADWQQTLGLQHFQKQIDWITMISESYKGYVDERNMPMIMKSAQIIADAMPQNHQANYEYGRLLVQANRIPESALYFRRAVIEEPDNPTYIKALNQVTQ